MRTYDTITTSNPILVLRRFTQIIRKSSSWDGLYIQNKFGVKKYDRTLLESLKPEQLEGLAHASCSPISSTLPWK